MSVVKPAVYRIQNVASKTYLDESRSNKDKVQCWGDRPNQGNQRWVVKKIQGQDAFIIHNFEFSRYLHIAEREQGSTLTATDDQPTHFIFKKEADGISIHLTNSNLCLDLSNGLKNDGELVHVYYDGNKSWQRWNFQEVATLEQVGQAGEYKA
ncbi:hypothetical protein FRC04_008126 [Tulasnella sp. 424]|nr:hypothetical protein FRC04_008126 [Tulasnella sp. 424]KAG8974783.1 hypothetical protein FRC05_006944 [Tulasnella sp. 425]